MTENTGQKNGETSIRAQYSADIQCNLLTSINSTKNKIPNTLYSSFDNCLRRRELNACCQERKAVKTTKQTDTQTYLVK